MLQCYFAAEVGFAMVCQRVEGVERDAENTEEVDRRRPPCTVWGVGNHAVPSWTYRANAQDYCEERHQPGMYPTAARLLVSNRRAEIRDHSPGSFRGPAMQSISPGALAVRACGRHRRRLRHGHPHCNAGTWMGGRSSREVRTVRRHRRRTGGVLVVSCISDVTTKWTAWSWAPGLTDKRSRG